MVWLGQRSTTATIPECKKSKQKMDALVLRTQKSKYATTGHHVWGHHSLQKVFSTDRADVIDWEGGLSQRGENEDQKPSEKRRNRTVYSHEKSKTLSAGWPRKDKAMAHAPSSPILLTGRGKKQQM